MSTLQLKNIQKLYGDNTIIRNINLDIHDGEFIVFVGPSGCGKSTTLRMIAGLEEITSGELFIDGKLANHLAPAHRGVAMVFQNYALYPQMTCAQNMGFALKMAGKSKDFIKTAVDNAAKVLKIEHHLNDYPRQLSGGERQRIAIGRAIVRNPKVFLFDEPLSNLDASLRVEMRIELSRLHKQLKTTMIYVTHDQTEAMTMGDRIAVFNEGKIEQIGNPLDLYDSPCNQFVAGFLGTPKINIINISGAHKLFDSKSINPATRSIGIRPDFLRIVGVNDGIKAQVALVEQLGDMTILYLNSDIDSTKLLILRLKKGDVVPNIGDICNLKVDVNNLFCFDENGNTIETQVNSV